MTANHQRDLLDIVSDLKKQVADLQGALALGSQAALCTSTTRPANPTTGRQILETDTGLEAYWTGTAWEYPPQQIRSVTLGTSAASVTLSGIPAVFNFLRLEFWVHRATTGPTDLTMQVDGISTNNYLWAKMESASAVQGNSHAGAATNIMKIGALGGTSSAYFSAGSVSIAGWSSNAGYLATTGTSALFDTNTVDYLDLTGSLFAGTGPHTSLTISALSGSLAAGSQFLLLGLG